MSGETVRLDASLALPNSMLPRPRPEYSASTEPDNGISDVGTICHDVAVTAAVYSPPFEIVAARDTHPATCGFTPRHWRLCGGKFLELEHRAAQSPPCLDVGERLPGHNSPIAVQGELKNGLGDGPSDSSHCCANRSGHDILR